MTLGVVLLAFHGSPFRFPSTMSVAIVLAVVVVSYAALQRHQERNLLHNLGMPVMLIVAISAIPAIVAESTVRILEMFTR